MTAKEFANWLNTMHFTKLSEVYQAHNKYFSPEVGKRVPQKKVYMGYCKELIADMVEYGATVEEIERAIIFSYVVLDCEKCRLSILAAKDDLLIDELYDKYVRKRGEKE